MQNWSENDAQMWKCEFGFLYFSFGIFLSFEANVHQKYHHCTAKQMDNKISCKVWMHCVRCCITWYFCLFGICNRQKMKIDHNTNVLLSIGQRACLGRRPTSYFTTSEANISALFEATETPDLFIQELCA